MTHVIFSVLVCYVLSAAAACRRSPNVECSVSSRARNISDMELSCVRPRNTCRALPPSSLHQTWDYRIQVDNLSTRRSRTPLVMHVVPFQYRIRTLPQRTRIISNRRSRCIFSGDERDLLKAPSSNNLFITKRTSPHFSFYNDFANEDAQIYFVFY